jgi:hypothetical protein
MMVDQQEVMRRIVELLLLKGHDRLVCLTAEMLSKAIADNPNLRIEDLLKSWGHNRAPGCVVCDTALSLVANDADVRVIDGVRITGRKS